MLLFVTSQFKSMPQANDSWFQNTAARDIHLEQLKTVERFNGRAAMLGIVIGIVTEGITGAGIVLQIGARTAGGWLRRMPEPSFGRSASDSEPKGGCKLKTSIRTPKA